MSDAIIKENDRVINLFISEAGILVARLGIAFRGIWH
jgi:pyruvate/2-oxoglutarate/acetoin dehydrogenase E1 component